jgi:hypothetical protein
MMRDCGRPGREGGGVSVQVAEWFKMLALAEHSHARLLFYDDDS